MKERRVGGGGVAQVTFHKGKNLGEKGQLPMCLAMGFLISGVWKVPVALVVYIYDGLCA